MQSIHHYNFKGKKALIRVDFNVPVDENSVITDDSLIRASLPTINRVLNDGGSVVLLSHFGEPRENFIDSYSMRHLVPRLCELLQKEVRLAPDCVYDTTMNMCKEMKPGEVILLENLSFHRCESNLVVEFAEQLSRYKDCFINDAFSTANQVLSSTTLVSGFFPGNKMFGYGVEQALARLIEDQTGKRNTIIGNMLGKEE